MKKFELHNLTIKLEQVKLFHVIGYTLHANGVTSKEFYNYVKEHGSLTSLFGNSVLNGIEDCEKSPKAITKEMTLKSIDEMILQLTNEIKNNKA